MIQDATFITSDPGHASSDTPGGEDAQTRRSKDGTWAKKGNKSYFVYKLHILMDKDCRLIRRLKTTTASTHDSQIDLPEKGETVYRDMDSFGVKPKASMDKMMHRSTRGHSLSIKEERRNRSIMRTRSLVERPFAVIKRGSHARTRAGQYCCQGPREERFHIFCLQSLSTLQERWSRHAS
ncbi:MAG: transposase [Methanoculleus sp.]